MVTSSPHILEANCGSLGQTGLHIPRDPVEPQKVRLDPPGTYITVSNPSPYLRFGTTGSLGHVLLVFTVPLHPPQRSGASLGAPQLPARRGPCPPGSSREGGSIWPVGTWHVVRGRAAGGGREEEFCRRGSADETIKVQRTPLERSQVEKKE